MAGGSLEIAGVLVLYLREVPPEESLKQEVAVIESFVNVWNSGGAVLI